MTNRKKWKIGQNKWVIGRKCPNDPPWRGSTWLFWWLRAGLFTNHPEGLCCRTLPPWCPVCRNPRRAERETSGADGRQVALMWALLGDMDSSAALIRRRLEKTPQLTGHLNIVSEGCPCKVWGDKGLTETYIPQPLPFTLCWGHNCLASKISRYTRQNKTSLIRRERKAQLCHFSVWRPWKMFWFPHDREPRTLGQKPSKQNTPGFNNLAFKFSN